MDEVDLSDEWVEQQRPPTIRLSNHGSLSGSVNILTERANNWENVGDLVTTDILSKNATNPLQALFCPPSAQGSSYGDVLSTVEEAASEEEPDFKNIRKVTQSYQQAWHDVQNPVEPENKENALSEHRAGSVRSAEGLIPNFSFPRGASVATQSELSPDDEQRNDEVPIQGDHASSDQHETPKKTHKSTNSSTSPSKSPLKIFQDPDTFTQDRMGQLINLLGAAPPPMAKLEEEPGETVRSTQSENTDSGPERKRIKTHEAKGSVTLQNMYDNAARAAAKLRAKGGGLGKGLPRLVEESGKRIMSSKIDTARQASGFEKIDIPVDRFATEPKFGISSTKSHFSDWDSVAQTDSRAVSGSTATVVPADAENDDELAAQSINPKTMYDSIRQTWTKSPGRISANDRPSTAPVQSPANRPKHSPSPSMEQRRVPHLKNFPPTELHTLRQGNMVFSYSRQCWRNADEGIQSPGRNASNADESRSQYPDELDLSLSASQSPVSARHAQSQSSVQDATTNSISDITDSFIDKSNAQAHQRRKSAVAIVATSTASTDTNDLSIVLDDMAMSESTTKLVTALNSRYGAGPWENVQRLDLRDLGLDSLIGLHRFFPSLTSLDISNNGITSLDGLPTTLQILQASGNKLASHRLSFEHLPNLQVLDLDRNQLEDIDSLRSLCHLRHLSINDNHLECIDSMRHLPNLISFEARGNMLTSIDFIDLQAYAPLEQLEKLDLAHNQLDSLLGLDTLDALIYFNVSHNRLQELEIVSTMEHLKVLKATHNELVYLDTTAIPKIRVLYLDDNMLEEITTPACLKYLESFSIRRQPVPTVIDLQALCEAQKLYFGGNNLPKFDFPTKFLSLKYLELAGCQISALPSDIARKVPNLRVLNVSNNAITSLAPLRGVDRLERLLAPHNKLSSAEDLSDVLVDMPRLKALDVRANPFTDRFYAPIQANHETDYFANLDGPKRSIEDIQAWAAEDDKFFATLSPLTKRRKEAYQNMIWSVCRSLKWHDGRKLDATQLLLADTYVDRFSQASLTDASILMM